MVVWSGGLHYRREIVEAMWWEQDVVECLIDWKRISLLVGMKVSVQLGLDVLARRLALSGPLPYQSLAQSQQRLRALLQRLANLLSAKVSALFASRPATGPAPIE